MEGSKKKKIFVGLSGGVDSSVAALRLLKEGHDVTGVFIKVWQPDFLRCNWEEERLDAMRVAAKLGIPFLTHDAEAAYKKEVAEFMINEYKEGRTPNPDVACNKAIKFGSFLQFAKEHGADGVATGHYAQNIEENGQHILKRGVDANKDQSYFLWTLTQNELRHIWFPVGNSTKESIRKEAEKHNLITAHKKDSQGVCFLGKLDMHEFLSHYINETEGPVVNQDNKVVGVHSGALFYTIGQRHGFTITEKTEMRSPYYVTGKDIDSNTLYVAKEKPTLEKKSIELRKFHFISKTYKEGDTCQLQIRYRQTPVSAQLVRLEPECGILKVVDELDTPAVGQSCVLYDNETCIGGGIIHQIHL